MIAHRGFAGENPENTVAAAKAAAGVRGRSAGDESTDRPADLIEIDVVPTGDGDVVVFHDDGLAERDGGTRGLTDADGVVWETDTATVTSAEVLNSGETVPRLSTFVEAVPADVGVNIELKNPGRTDLRFAEKLSEDELSERTAAWQPFVDRVVDTLDGHDNEFLFSSFYEGALAAVREVSSYAVAPVFWRSVEDGLAIAREHDAEAVHPADRTDRRNPVSRRVGRRRRGGPRRDRTRGGSRGERLDGRDVVPGRLARRGRRRRTHRQLSDGDWLTPPRAVPDRGSALRRLVPWSLRPKIYHGN
jgi:Glycerophosphoryl diester phosphodiesterase